MSHSQRTRAIPWVFSCLLGLAGCGGSDQSVSTGPGGGSAHPGIYVADASNNRVVRVDDMAGAQWVALGPQCGSGPQVSSPLGLFVDRDGKIYVANGGNNMIQRMDDMAGTNCTSFGSGGSGTNEFSVPAGIFVDQGGKIYVADALNDRIVRIDDMSGRTGPALTHPARRATSSSTRPAAST